MGSPCYNKLQVKLWRVGGRQYLWARNAKRRKSGQSLSSKFIGLKM